MHSSRLQDLTGKVRKIQTYHFAVGGLADIWMGELSLGNSKQIVLWLCFQAIFLIILFALSGCSQGYPRRLQQDRVFRTAQDGEFHPDVLTLYLLILVPRNYSVRQNSGASWTTPTSHPSTVSASILVNRLHPLSFALTSRTGMWQSTLKRILMPIE
jgi:hypothetical protein